jgi:hypothetical protein
VKVSFNFFEKLAVDLSLSLLAAPYLPHFQSVLCDLKFDGCPEIKALQNFISFQRQECNNQRF